MNRQCEGGRKAFGTAAALRVAVKETRRVRAREVRRMHGLIHFGA
jgi:hypothetical protein